MAKMSELYKMAERIKNVQLRRKVVAILRNPGKLSSKSFARVSPCSFEEAPASTNFHHIYKGGLLDHVVAVARMAISVAETLESIYGAKIDFDSLIAGALLHDHGKLWKMAKENDAWGETNLMLDHTMLWVSELYARGFPESVIHIVAAHFGEDGPTPPMNIEATILHEVDNFDAKIGTVDQESLLQQILSQQGK
jgi:7,8-dihydroneopterin 2',3'-cyclic phosphate phosphodiesterase